MSSSFLEQPIDYVKGVGPAKGDILRKDLEVFTVADLLQHYPYRYVDRTAFYKINEIREEGTWIQISGKILGMQIQGVKRKARLTALLGDDTGTIELIWFQGLKWITEKLKTGETYVVFGRVGSFSNRFNMPHPEIQPLIEFNSTPRDKMQPLYHTSEKMKSRGLDSKGVTLIIRNILDHPARFIPESLPEWIMDKANLINLNDALNRIHFPQSAEWLQKAVYRLKYEELFLIQLHLLSIKHNRYRKVKGFRFEKVGEIFHQFYNHHLPFELTGAQKRVIKEMRADMGSGRQMNRLLQGDVGSGKTLVALLAALLAIDNGYQTALMAPTEILANQHLKTITKFLEGIAVNVAILTGTTKHTERKKILQALLNGEIHILIGTHALIEDRVVFNNLGLIVIDEQHRFGVEQRAKLRLKNTTPPHVLVMTATPIPRTLAMTLYGDLDSSIIDELPPGRKPVKTVHAYDAKRISVFEFVKEQIALGRQVYFVYPLIEESEKLDLKDLMDGYESITREFPLPEYAVSIVHGKMPPEDKAYEMARFVKGETQIMVSTTVIEVGVDVPNASVMVIENAERFGLSQLHQLRGRVGRGADQSFCILMTDFKLTKDAKKRIATMVESNDGFVIADVDLSLRGPGEMQGTRQSGLPDLKIADLAKDDTIMKQARELAIRIIEKDSLLIHEMNKPLKQALKNKFREKADYTEVG
jgi:ATP-dependent DNA helicase RecG